MRFIRNLSNRFRGNEEGQSLVEYGLIIALIALVVIGVLAVIGTNLGNLFSNIANTL